MPPRSRLQASNGAPSMLRSRVPSRVPYQRTTPLKTSLQRTTTHLLSNTRAEATRSRAEPTRTSVSDTTDLAETVYSALHRWNFPGSIPKMATKPPQNEEIPRMFSFLYGLTTALEPDSLEVGTMLLQLGYSEFASKRIGRDFSKPYFMANSSSAWPSIVRALNYMVQFVEASGGDPVPIPGANRNIVDSSDPDTYRLVQEYVLASFTSRHELIELDLQKLLNNARLRIEPLEHQAANIAERNKKLVAEIENCRKLKSDYSGFIKDGSSLQTFKRDVGRNLEDLASQMRVLEAEVSIMQEKRQHLSHSKTSIITSLEATGLDLDTLMATKEEKTNLDQELSQAKCDCKSEGAVIERLRKESLSQEQDLRATFERIARELGVTFDASFEGDFTNWLMAQASAREDELEGKTARIWASTVSIREDSFKLQCDLYQLERTRNELERSLHPVDTETSHLENVLELLERISRAKGQYSQAKLAMLTPIQQELENLIEEKSRADTRTTQLDAQVLDILPRHLSRVETKHKSLQHVLARIEPGLDAVRAEGRKYRKIVGDFSKFSDKFKFPWQDMERDTQGIANKMVQQYVQRLEWTAGQNQYSRDES